MSLYCIEDFSDYTPVVLEVTQHKFRMLMTNGVHRALERALWCVEVDGEGQPLNIWASDFDWDDHGFS
jgi:hypothetical protein